MNNAQKSLVKRTISVIFLVILIWIASSFLSHSLSHEWLLTHRSALLVSGFVLFVLAGAFTKKNKHVPTYLERHEELNQLVDTYPWIKIYVVVYSIAIALGLYYVSSNQVDMAALLDKVGFFGFAAMILMLMLPIFIVKLMKTYDEARKEE
ncbi:MAG: hypothetical protein KKF58_04830 [Gammaproteobacteria bacterium]|nr:hypothetical protein [Gammaproteobacteria bacterium]